MTYIDVCSTGEVPSLPIYTMSIQVTVCSISLHAVIITDFLCMYIIIYMITECLPYVMYRMWGNKFTESGETRLHQAQQEREKLTGFGKLYLIT